MIPSLILYRHKNKKKKPKSSLKYQTTKEEKEKGHIVKVVYIYAVFLHTSLTVTRTIMSRHFGPFISQSLSENILSGLQRGLDLLIVVGQLDGLLAGLIPDARVTASLTHHLDHFRTDFSVLFAGVAHGSMEGGVVV